LAKINGKPMLQWVVEAAKQCSLLSKVIVATDNGPIFELAQSLGVQAAMTAETLPTGTDRVYAATLNEDCDVVVNIQGDEPLLKPDHLEALISPFGADASLDMATLCAELPSRDLHSKDVVKVIKNQFGDALYFSRFPIPYSRLDAPPSNLACWKHIGLYAYKKSVLKELCAQPQAELEKGESLEQLRALYLGKRIRVEYVTQGLHGVDNPEDIERVESLLD
jgi:3-deoxy-manno-octulosonate cytidylyltransferase (CMP-KDO synthetase)